MFVLVFVVVAYIRPSGQKLRHSVKKANIENGNFEICETFRFS